MVAVVAAVLLAACGSSSKSSSPPSTTTTVPKTRPKITVVASEYKFVMPRNIPAGWVDVTLQNKGETGHQIAFVKLNSLTYAQFKAAASATDLSKIKDAQFVGGPNNVDPGQSVTATVHLTPGAYAVACFIPADSDGKPHAAHGMIGQVTAVQSAASDDEAPTADAGKVALSEFTFVPDAAFTGQGTVEIDNVGNQVHEMIIMKLADGKTLTDAKKFLLAPPGSPAPAGAPPLTSAGGIVGLGPHQKMFETLSLTPGKYVLACFFPDTSKPGGIPHALEGMLKEITIS